MDVSARGYAFVPLRGGGDPIGRGELRARVHAQPWTELPLTLDADAAVQLRLGDSLDAGPGAASRPTRARASSIVQLATAWHGAF